MTKYPFMPFYVADFQADTMHLNWKEKAAYRAILDAYWLQGEGPKNDDKRLARIVGMTSDEWSEVRESVLEFFTIEDGSLVQKRIEIEMTKAKMLSEYGKIGGLASAEKRKAEKEAKKASESNGNATPVEPPLNPPSNGNATPVQQFTSTSTSTVTENPIAEFVEEFAGAEKNPARENSFEPTPEDLQAALDGETSPPSLPPSKPPIQSHGMSIPAGHCERFTNGDLDEVVARFGTRSQEALDVIALHLAAGDYRHKRPWFAVKTWLAKEASATAWLDKATGKGKKPWEPTPVVPMDTTHFNAPPAPEHERADLEAEGFRDFIRRPAATA